MYVLPESDMFLSLPLLINAPECVPSLLQPAAE
jgi:hypothetical protein